MQFRLYGLLSGNIAAGEVTRPLRPRGGAVPTPQLIRLGPMHNCPSPSPMHTSVCMPNILQALLSTIPLRSTHC